MKLHIQLTGTFNRIAINSTVTDREAVTLQQWMQKHFSVATQVRQPSPLLLRKRFGMSFLSESSILELLKKAYSTEAIENINLIPSWLQPSETITAKPILYRYEFVSQTNLLSDRQDYLAHPRIRAESNAESEIMSLNATRYQQAKIELQSDAPQLPYHWETDNIAGIYEILVEGNTYPGVSQTWLDAIWLKVKQEWENSSSCDRLQMALQSLDNTEFSFYLPDIPTVKVSIDIKQLSSEIQEAIAFLRQEIINIESLSSAARELVQEYQQNHAPAPSYFLLPEDIKLKTSIASPHQFIIGTTKSRKAIEDLINQAEQFLFISSYIIEDTSITELICQKATTLPQGVWILTDLNDEVIDAIDTQVENIPSSREAYQHSDAKKAQCLKLLLDAGARIRGGAFHLKTYISEKVAYLGSCNLTGGSLDFNLESGLICQGNTTHQDLLQYFILCWKHKTKYDVLPLESGFNQRTLNNSSPTDTFNSQTLLTPRQYRQDLYRELSKCSGRVAIYSRGFFPDAEIISLLETRSTHVSCVYYNNSISNKNNRITTRFSSEVHAKITLIGDRVAYIGGVNFQFAPQRFKLIDLMYKTCDSQEINQIRQQLYHF